MSDNKEITAGIIVIGDEILSGRTKDQNIATIAAHLTSIGIRLKEIRIVADDEAAIVEAVNALRDRLTYVFTTGGIGPTHDDITADSIAAAFGRQVIYHAEAERLMEAFYKARGAEMTEARRRMARTPEGAVLIDNPLSGAPGFIVDNVIVMAGVPAIMRAMLQGVTGQLETGAVLHSETVPVDRAESEVADVLAEQQRVFADVAMGSYPCLGNGRPAADLVLRSTDPQRLQQAVAALKTALDL